ncbi:hypothetical protein Psed_5816 [Pseudonocardia dioxanivorans CB1190]|uniref:DUF732 domain-containing protein n=1 Tax=Pseudonocardia dioxanivorans (strain ATCC 55486 / DSM 44775 / JCM 13855 / CB1190) TaxID=675635 RepID=F4D1F3_PSEUX|nr:DUF732 domain-containing protein [Pseudonocardia dioxanivorans]AEA27941.1 hypothetical protein Psed_5816 [Pseudonocardia dioxanivorans CB1190]
MRRVLLVLVAALAPLVLAGCSNTPAEDAFLAQVQRDGSEIELSDPGKHLEQGHALCDGAAKLKTADRDTIMYMTARQMGWLTDYYAAKAHLCPELFPSQ